MSRSYKKYPVFGTFKSQFFKKQHNKKIRKMDVPDFGGHKKIGDSWSIQDFKICYFDNPRKFQKKDRPIYLENERDIYRAIGK